MDTSQIPKDVAVAISECWPDGIVEAFATDESYFHEIHPRLERDLRDIRGVSLRWQTEEDETGARWDEDDEPPRRDEWQSYCVFFLSPDSKEFHFEDETAGMEDREDPREEEGAETTYQGDRWIGCAAGICLAAPYAVINLSSYSRYEDGTMSIPDVRPAWTSSSKNRCGCGMRFSFGECDRRPRRQTRPCARQDIRSRLAGASYASVRKSGASRNSSGCAIGRSRESSSTR